jgi:hypothetical protein
MCFKLLKPSPNDLKFIVTFEIIHMKGHMRWSLYVYIYWINVDNFNFECP